MVATASNTKSQLELRLLLAAAARVGIAPTVSTSGSGAVEMIAAASDRGARLVGERRTATLGCRGCQAVWEGVLVPAGSVDVGCPLCEGELHEVLASMSVADSATTATGVTAIMTHEAITVAQAHTPAPAPAAAPTPAPSGPATVSNALPGKIGHYQVVKVLGRGGMGAVLEAVDERTQARVAVKLIAGWSATDLDARLRFEREGKVLTLLAHPHIVRFVERGEHGEQLYIAMELVSGRSLADVLEKGALSVPEAARIARAVAEGLGYAHALGLVHRDVKPGNVLLGDDGSIKLADFGLARRREESLALTAPGTVVGTPIYMAPEQLEGTTVGPAADIYALGVVLYHMLAGAPPFEGSFAQIAAKRQKGEIAPLRTKCPGCPVGLQALVERLLSRDAAARPSATETARILSSFEPPSTVTRAPQSAASAVVRDARTLAAGDRVGPFTIEGKLGAGGMGSVFKARRADGSLVALKLIARPLDANASQRFAREARALAEASHANVVRFLDAGESDGLSWIATELVPGRSLDEVVLAEGALPEARLLDVAEAVASALAALHARGIVHRDVKPQNIMMRPDGGVTLVDLGLAKFLATQTALTETGALLGTPHYMSPEQLLGRPVDARTDLYALGASLYHAATAKRPFDGETTTAVAFQQVNVAPAPVRTVNKRLSAPFGALVARLLEKRAERRPASADAVLGLVARVRRGEALDAARTRVTQVVGFIIAALVIVCVVAIWLAARYKETGALYAGVPRAMAEKIAREPAPEAKKIAATTKDAPLQRPMSSGKPMSPAPLDELRATNTNPIAPAPAVTPAPTPHESQGGVFGGGTSGGSGRQPGDGAASSLAEAENRFEPRRDAATEQLEKKKEAALDAKTAVAEKHDAAKPAAAPVGAAAGPAVLVAEKTRATDGARVLLVAQGERSFYVDAREVTVAQWKKYREAANGAEHFGCDPKREPADWKHARPELGKDDEPVRGLGVWDAEAYARWAGGRLPTSDEWEKAVATLPALEGSLAEWVLDVTGETAKGRLGRAKWISGDGKVSERRDGEPLEGVGFRCVQSTR